MSSPSSEPDPMWGRQTKPLVAVARNVGTRYLVIATDAFIGMLVLPFNVHHLGQSAWGLWMLTSSLNSYFSILDLGYGGSVTRFVALYRARRDVAGLNEILSTLAVFFSAFGVVAYGIFALVAVYVTAVFNLTPDQVVTARTLLLITGAYVAMGFPFSVFGGVMNGFQRYDLNNVVGIGTTILVAIVNVAMLLSGYSLVQLVAVTTSIRMAAYLVYRMNAYRVFPALSLRPSRFRLSRLREVTGFSVYMSIINWSARINYAADSIIIGAFMSPAAVAIWTVPQRMAQFVQRLTNQLNGVLLPLVVDSDAGRRPERLRAIFIQGTLLSLLGVVPLAAALFMLADGLITGWVGSQFSASVAIAQILATVMVFRVGSATATVVLKGAGEHRMLAFTNGAVALVNLALSLWWIQQFGLVGQAFGTLVPVAIADVFVLWPAACRRVGIGTAEAFKRAVWPALWPIAVMAATVLPLRAVLPRGLYGVAAAGAVGGLCYVAAFLGLAIPTRERRTYVAKALELARRRGMLPAAA